MFLILTLLMHLSGPVSAQHAGLEVSEKRMAIEQAVRLASQNVERDPETAIANLHKALRLATELRDTLALARVHRLWGTVHYYLNNNRSALEHWGAGLQLAQTTADSSAISGLLHNLGNLYSEIRPDSSLYYYQAALSYHDPTEDSSYTAMIYSNLALCFYDDLNLPDSSQIYVDRAHAIYLALQDKEGLATTYAHKARLLTDKGAYDEAIRHAQKARELGEQLASSRILEHALDALRVAYYEQGNYKMAYETVERLLLLMDSVAASEKLGLITQMEKKAELIQADAEIATLNAEKGQAEAELSQQRVLILSSAIGLGLLVITFVSIIRGKRRSDELLLNILPYETAQELKKKGKTKVMRLEMVSVLFSDFKDFTAISSRLSPEELVNELDHCFSAFDRIMEKHGVEKIKTIGDAYMAAGGVPVPVADHALRTVRAALEIQQFMAARVQTRKRTGKPYFEVRLGIHSGPVVAGIVGLKKFQYDIWGDTVNTASRMESSGEEGKVNISESTYEMVKDTFACTYRGEIEAKGKGKVKMYFVAGPSEKKALL